MCLAFQEQPPLSILCRLQVARSQALTERTSWCLVGWNSAVVSAGDTASDFFFARPHFGNGLVLPGPRTLSSSQSTPHPRPQPPPLLSGSMLITQLLPQAFRLAQGSQSHTRATRSVLQGQPGRSRLGQMPGGSYGKEESSWTAMLQLPAGKTSSPPQLRSPNRSAPARLQPGVTFQQ